jgi:hypothetical protein
MILFFTYDRANPKKREEGKGKNPGKETTLKREHGKLL